MKKEVCKHCGAELKEYSKVKAMQGQDGIIAALENEFYCKECNHLLLRDRIVRQ